MKTAVLPVCRSWKASSVHSKLDALRQHLRGERLHRRRAPSPDETPGAALPCSGTDGVHVVALHERSGPVDVADLDQRAERHQRAGRRAHLAGAVMSSRSTRNALVGLGAHLVDAAEGVEVVDIGGAEIDLQRLEDVRRSARSSMRALSRSIVEDRTAARWREKVVKTPVRPGVWLALPAIIS